MPGTQDELKIKALVLCSETIAKYAMLLGLERYNMDKERCGNYIGQLERINELKAKLYNLENCLEDLYSELNDADILLEDEDMEELDEALAGQLKWKQTR